VFFLFFVGAKEAFFPFHLIRGEIWWTYLFFGITSDVDSVISTDSLFAPFTIFFFFPFYSELVPIDVL
jgi:hypothetical protein